MAIRWNWIQGSVGDIPVYSAQNDRDVIAAMWDEGVIRGMPCTGGTPARTVIVGAGQCVVQGDDAGNIGQQYVVTSTATETASIAAAPATGSRIDLVGWQVQDVAAGFAGAGNDVVLRVVAGTPGTPGVMPALPNSMLVLCTVTISAGQTAVTDGMITDVRLYSGPKEPVGSLKWWYGPATKIPNGWKALTVAGGETIGPFGTYPDLARLLGVTSGNIVVGNPRGRTLMAVDPTDATIDTHGELAGAATATLAAGNLPAHQHTIDHDHPSTAVNFGDPGHSHPSVGAASGTGLANRIPGSGSDDIYNAGTAVSLGWVANPPTSTAFTGITGTVDLPNLTGVSSGVGPGSSTAFPIRPPVMAVHLLLRVL